MSRRSPGVSQKSKVGGPKPEEGPKAEGLKRKAVAKSEKENNPDPDSDRDDIPQSEINTKSDPDSYRDVNPKSEIKTMEVHHHPQLEHKHKPWKEYLLEGLMIFLAVTMGFFAESLREHINNNEREKQYVQSMIEDLKDDRRKLEVVIKNLGKSKAMMSSMISILNDPANIPGHGDELYYYGRLGPRLNTVTINMRTYEQLKNSGNFRLISKMEISNDIMAYYEKIPFMRQIEDLYTEEFANYKRFAANVFEPAVFIRQETGEGNIVKGTDNPPLQKNSREFIKQLAVYAIYMNGSRKQILTNDEDLLKSAGKLLDQLQKEYDLADE